MSRDHHLHWQLANVGNCAHAEGVLGLASTPNLDRNRVKLGEGETGVTHSGFALLLGDDGAPTSIAIAAAQLVRRAQTLHARAQELRTMLGTD